MDEKEKAPGGLFFYYQHTTNIPRETRINTGDL